VLVAGAQHRGLLHPGDGQHRVAAITGAASGVEIATASAFRPRCRVAGRRGHQHGPAVRCTGQIVFRIDSAYHNAAVLGAIRRAGAYFSVTVPLRRDIRAAIAAIPGDAWTLSPTRGRSGMRTRNG
jgi:hypothetical protein